MAATFTPITIEEIDAFLKRAFRVLRPSAGPNAWGGEVTRDLHLGDAVVIRIMTSVHQGGSDAAGKGSDAIRVQLFSRAGNRPLKSGKMPIVKRTQGWRDNLRERIEDCLEEFDDKREYWESRA